MINSEEVKKRIQAETDFHNKKFGGNREKDYYAHGFTSIVIEHLFNLIGNVEDKNVLEIGCGEGWVTKRMALQGAQVWAFDISKEAVNLVVGRLQGLNLKYPVKVEVMAGEELTYDDNMFDCVIGLAILHHLEFEPALNEIKRVLKPGGRAYFMEPLGHNPILNLYRFLTPNLRSKDEAPLRWNQYRKIAQNFACFYHHEFFLTALISLFFYFVKLNKIMILSRDVLVKFDNIILKIFPFLKKYCWYSVLVFEK
jgi:ubiquinone/menaquinone biosynthesis C-methylase UbiE